MKTLRFTIINGAARVARIHGRRVLRFSRNPATQVLYDQVLDRLAARFILALGLISLISEDLWSVESDS
jgi:hypothetical protein